MLQCVALPIEKHCARQVAEKIEQCNSTFSISFVKEFGVFKTTGNQLNVKIYLNLVKIQPHDWHIHRDELIRRSLYISEVVQISEPKFGLILTYC